MIQPSGQNRHRLRLCVTVLGPLPIIAASLGLSLVIRSERPDAPASNHVVPAAAPQRSALAPVAEAAALQAEGRQARLLAEACRAAAQRLSGQLGPPCSVVVRPPFVIAGDMDEATLEHWHQRTIGPAARAMASSYFHVAPYEPVTVLLFSGEQSYSRYAGLLFGDEGISVYGYYKPHLRTLVMNIGTGGGTLVHELTHALLDFDFPRIPDWFNEGLASLHEQCQIRPDETGIDGLVNWRLATLKEAVRRNRLPPLERLIQGDDFRGPQIGLNYAQARYLCLYLQQQGKLAEFYRRFRQRHPQDVTGASTLADVLGPDRWASLDADFQRWVLGLEP